MLKDIVICMDDKLQSLLFKPHTLTKRHWACLTRPGVYLLPGILSNNLQQNNYSPPSKELVFVLLSNFGLQKRPN